MHREQYGKYCITKHTCIYIHTFTPSMSSVKLYVGVFTYNMYVCSPIAYNMLVTIYVI